MKATAVIAVLVSIAICIFLWFRDVRRIMRRHQSTVESAKSQLDICRANSERAAWDPDTAAVLRRSESICRQAVYMYETCRKKWWIRLPAFLLGFKPAEKIKAPIPVKKQRYIGSVRFFKNLILIAVIIMIVVPTAAALHLSRTLRLSEAQIYDKEVENANLIHEKELLSEELRQHMEVEPAEIDLWELFKAESPYAGLYPDFYSPHEISADLKENKAIYLTFDDGPSARTAEVLDILKEKSVKATFFVVGNDSEEGRAMLRRIVDEGHTLGMHTYSHNYTDIYKSVEAYLDDMYKIFTQIKDATGTTPTLYRFPGGSINAYNSHIYQELISEMLRRGFIPYDWNLANSDAMTNRLVPAQTLIDNVLNNADRVDRGVVLMHDSLGKTTTVEALGPTIDGLREKGFELRALTPEIMPVLFSYDN